MKNLLSNPVLVKELRGRMRGNRAMYILTAYLTIIGIVTLLVYLTMVGDMSFGVSDPSAGARAGKAIFLTVMVVSLLQVCIISPALTAGSIAGERERQTYDLLVTTLLSPWQIALGKLGSALAFAVLLNLAVLPLAGLSLLFGGVSFVELLIGMTGLLVSAVLFASVGLFWSSVMQSTQGALVVAQGIVLVWLAGIPFLFFVLGVNFFDVDWTNSVIGLYTIGAVLCMHPFLALGITAAQLAEGGNPLYALVYVNDVPQGVVTPSPWLVYVAFALVATLVLVALSVRLLTPSGYTRNERKQQIRRIPPSAASPAAREPPSGTNANA